MRPPTAAPYPALWLAALFAYHLAWTTHPAAAFTLNAFDLAEQIRYHPAILAQTPPLRTAMLLWAGIPLLAMGLASAARDCQNQWVRWGGYGIALVVALRVMPPQQALRSPTTLLSDDYTFALTLLSGIGILGVVAMLFVGHNLVVRGGLLLSALILPLLGFGGAFNLLRDLQLEIQIGGGLGIYSLVLLLGAGWWFIQIKKASGDFSATATVA